MTPDKFFRELYHSCTVDGWIEARHLPYRGGSPIRAWYSLAQDAKDRIIEPPPPGYNAFFGVGTRAGCNRGDKDSVLQIPALWVDIDFKNAAPPGVIQRLREFPLKHSAAVFTGGGMHVYWFLEEPAEQPEIPKVEAINRGLAEALEGDPASTDAARILRVPGTLNWKYEPPRKCWVPELFDVRYNLSDFADFEKEAAPRFNGPSNDTIFNNIFKACAFMRHCRDNAKSLSELHWFQMISNLARLPGGVDKIHELSRPYKGYTARETNHKILRSINASRAITCAKISEGFPGCKGCKYRSINPTCNQHLDD